MKPGRMTDTQLSLLLGHHVRLARTEARLTQEEAAEVIGLAAEVFGRAERGKMLFSLPTFRRVCLYLGVDANVALGLTHPERAKEVHRGIPRPVDPRSVRIIIARVRRMSPDQLRVIASVTRALVEAQSADEVVEHAS